MDYNTNTPNYNTRNRKISNFSDFNDNIKSDKEELKDVKRSMNLNHDDTQKYPKNSRYKFNKVTRKLDDLTIDDVDDLLEESLSNTIDSMKRYLEDYREKHNAFEKRGMDEGVEILRNSEDIEDGINAIMDNIEKWELKEKGDLMPEEQRRDIIKGLKDLIAVLNEK